MSVFNGLKVLSIQLPLTTKSTRIASLPKRPGLDSTSKEETKQGAKNPTGPGMARRPEEPTFAPKGRGAAEIARRNKNNSRKKPGQTARPKDPAFTPECFCFFFVGLNPCNEPRLQQHLVYTQNRHEPFSTNNAGHRKQESNPTQNAKANAIPHERP